MSLASHKESYEMYPLIYFRGYVKALEARIIELENDRDILNGISAVKNQKGYCINNVPFHDYNCEECNRP